MRNEFARLNENNASEIDKKIKQTYLSLQEEIKSVCKDKNIKFALSVMLDDLVCTAVSLGIMTATKDLNNCNKKRSKK